MSGGTPAQNLTLTLVIGVLVVAIALWIVVGRVRRTRATGAAESGSVRTRGQAQEIADRIHAYCSGDTAGSTTEGPRVEVLGAARLQAALRADDEVGAESLHRVHRSPILLSKPKPQRIGPPGNLPLITPAVACAMNGTT